MPRRLAAINETIIINEPIDPEDVEEATVEDYRKLNERCDKVISKIKDRKGKKKK